MDNGRLHLLVVEDDEDDFILLRHLLLKALREVAVERACSGRDALAAVQRTSYDASFFDYRLGAESGLDLLQQFRQGGVDVPVIFLTGQGDEEVAVQAMKAGAVDYLLKSKLSEASLTQAVRYALNLHRKEMLLRQAQQELRGSEERFRALVEHSHDLTELLDAQGVTTWASQSWLQIMGFPPEELTGKHGWDLVHPEDRPAVRAAFQWGLQHPGMPRRIEFRSRHQDGSWRWLEAVGVNRLRDPAVKAVVVNYRDVTARREAEDALQRTSEALRAVFQASPLALLVLLPNGHVAQWNLAAERIFGWSEQEAVGHFNPMIRDCDRDAYLAHLRGVLKGNTTLGYQAVARRRDGAEIDVSISTAPLQGGGEARGAVALIADITERKRAEEALRRSRDEWEITFNSMSEAVSFHDNQFHILRTNEAFRQLTAGRQGATCSQLVHGTETPPPTCPMARLLQTKQTETAEFFEPTIGRMLSVRTDPVLNSAGELTSVVHVIYDITERRTLQEQLQQAQKMEAIGQLAGGIAHDFNNLLMVITSYAELMLDGVGDNATWRRDTEEILKAGRRAASLTQQLLAFSRKQVLDPRVLDLNATLAEINKLMPRLVGEDISVEFVPAPGLWPVKADPVQIEQVVMNLAANARDAMPQGGRLILETSNVCLNEEYARCHISARAGEYVLLTVSDTGVGIDPAVRPHIFEPFFTTKENGKGTGLGLSSVYGIVKQSGGYIWVYSEVGHGSTFKIYLPRATGAYEPLPGTGRFEGNVGGSETILLVEDEDAVRQATHEFLERNGYTVLQAHCGTEAIAIAERYQGQIDLLVTDVVMPGMSGRELAARLLAARPQLKVLYVSGYTERVLQHGVADTGCTFLQKPFSLNALGCKVRELVEPMAGAASAGA